MSVIVTLLYFIVVSLAALFTGGYAYYNGTSKFVDAVSILLFLAGVAGTVYTVGLLLAHIVLG